MIDTLDTEALVRLADLIDEAKAKLEEYFPGCEQELEEFEGAMVLTVYSTYAYSDSREMMHRFDRDWWLEKLSNSLTNLTITWY